MRDIGLKVDVQAMDWATMLKRRNSKEPASNGGWNLLHSYTGGQVVSTPVWSIAFSGACEKGLFGWPCDQKLEDLRLKWALVDGVEAKKAVAAEYSGRPSRRAITSRSANGRPMSPIAAKVSGAARIHRTSPSSGT